MDNTKDIKKDTEIVRISPRTGKPMKKPRGGNSPLIGDNGVHTQPGDNSKYAMVLLEMHKWGEVNKSDPKALEDRFWKYVEFCGKNDLRVTNQVAYYAMGMMCITGNMGGLKQRHIAI